MKTRSMNTRSLIALVALAFGVSTVACSAGGREEGEGQENPPGTGGSGSGGSGTGGSGSGPALSTGDELKVSQARARCDESQTAAPQLKRLTRIEYENTLRDVFPGAIDGTWASKMTPDQASKLGFTNNGALLTVAQQTAEQILDTAEDLADLVLGDAVIGTTVPCAATADAACATTVIDTYAPRLFRRPITDEERARYLALFTSVSGQSEFKTGLKWMLVALLQSPNTVYRSEIGEEQGGERVLTQYELASELSYTFAGQPPDQELLDLATANQLGDASVRAAQAQRLLRLNPRGLEVVRRFFREWLEYGLIEGKAREDVADFATLAPKLIEETQLYIDNAIFQDGGDFSHLMTGNFTILTPETAAHYGYGQDEVTASGVGVARVERPAGQGIGLLAQGAVLASTSHETATSPTLRGLLVFEKLLCNDRPAPPAGVPPIENTAGQANTTRERYENIHLSDSGCASCHKNWEPSGFTFEQFDETGRYRADENSYPVDTSGGIKLADGTEVPLANLDALSQAAATTAQIQDCFSGFLTDYMLGGGGGVACLAEPERDALASGDMGIEEFLIALTNTPSFTTRK